MYSFESSLSNTPPFIQKDYAEYLPRLRGSFENIAQQAGSPAAQVDAGSELIRGS